MSTEGDDQTGSRYSDAWRARVFADLEAYRAEEQQLWGGIDEAAMARYEAGVSPEAERARVSFGRRGRSDFGQPDRA